MEPSLLEIPLSIVGRLGSESGPSSFLPVPQEFASSGFGGQAADDGDIML